MRAQLLEPAGAALDELAIDRFALDQVLEHAAQERDVAADRDLEEVVHDLRAEQRAAHVARHPVALEARLAHRVHHHHPRAPALGLAQVLERDRLVVREVRAEDHDKLAPDHVLERTGGRRDSERVLEARDAGRVAQPRAQVDVVRAHQPGRFLEHVIRLVHDPARGREEPHALARHVAQRLGRDRERLVPRQPVEPVVAGAMDHRERHAPQLAQLLVRQPAQLGDALQPSLVRGAHGVQAEQLEPRHAQVDAGDHVVAQPARAQRAAVAHAAREDAPGVREVVAVLPHHLRHLEVRPGARVPPRAERDQIAEAEAAAARSEW